MKIIDSKICTKMLQHTTSFVYKRDAISDIMKTKKKYKYLHIKTNFQFTEQIKTGLRRDFTFKSIG